MRFKAILLSAFALISLTASAQDKIYKKSGDVIEGKVKEVNTRNISYKRTDNPDGPDYVINRNEVEKIKYQNGSEDYMGERRREESVGSSRKPQPKIEYGGNIISLALINLNDEGFGFGLAYERNLDQNGNIAFYLPINVCMGGLGNGNVVYDPTFGGYTNTTMKRTIYQLMPGVKFYPTGNKGKVRYAIGALVDYETGTKEVEQYVYTPTFPSGYYKLGNADLEKFGIMIHNSLNMFPNAHIFIGLDLGLGLTYMNKEQDLNTGSMIEQGTTQLAQFNFRIGYRF
jgi:hypothetical protein